jgi:amidase
VQLHELTALEQGEAIRRGEVHPVELVEHYLARIAALDPQLGAFVTVTGEQALAQARATEPSGRPLAGVPTAVKDLVLTAGVPTKFGSAAFADFVPPVDADVVRLLREAGLSSLGKTATSEFGLSCYVETEIGPPTRNPWSLRHTAGGSSGGAAAAVAAGLISIGHGNDGGGSVRIPSAICGLVGYKPSRGLVSGGPLGDGGFGLPTNGVLARTVTDAAAMLDAIAVPVPGEPYPAPVFPPGGYLAAARRDPGRLKVGRFLTPFLADVPVDPACVAAVDATASALIGLGHEVVEVPVPAPGSLTPLFEVLWTALAASLRLPDELEAKLQPLSRHLRARGRALTAVDLTGALGGLQAAVRDFAGTLTGFDLVLCPVLASPQAEVGAFTAGGDPAEDFARQERFSPFCAWFNLTGAPAVALPVGRTEDGLPVGVQLAGTALALAHSPDATLLAAAGQLERAGAWTRRHPGLWAVVAPG